MYGTVARLRPKEGQRQDLFDMMEDWNRTRAPQVKGVVGAYMMIPDNKPGEALMIAMFEDKEAYFANANDPEQDRWYQRFRERLEVDPVWEDGEFHSV